MADQTEPETTPDEEAPRETPTPKDVADHADKASDEGEKHDVEYWKRMSRRNEDRMKANAEKARAFDDLKAEHDAQTSKLADLESSAGEATTRAVRAEMALKYGLGYDDLDLLGDGDADQIEARATRKIKRSP
ncbi:MAG: hypothetical protein E7A62_02785 [Actinomycetaceae bacterium]|nr:hypothetical protein [Actinomycetaceae bacterium]MDU0969907.1 hypothetical protein [Actinomycetaceae bacterium]